MVPKTILQVLTPKQEMASQGIHVTAWFIEDQEFYIYTEQNYNSIPRIQKEYNTWALVVVNC